MSPSRTRRFPGVTLLTLLALAAAPAEGREARGEARGEQRGTFTVGVTVVRSAAVRVEARPEGGALRIDARVERGGRGPAGGVQIAPAGAPGRFTDGEGSLSADLAGERGRVVVVTVLPDGRPPAIRLRD
jgi:hypothetical protein